MWAASDELARVARQGKQLVLVFLTACQGGQAAEPEKNRLWEEAGIVDALISSGVPAAVHIFGKLESALSVVEPLRDGR